MPRARLDRDFERRLAGLINARARGRPAGRSQGRRTRIAAGHARRPDRDDAAPEGARLGAHNEHITTDYSEALIELVTPPFPRPGNCCSTSATCTGSSIRNLRTTNCSGPRACRARSRATRSIPIAQFGTSNVGRMKNVYRNGLGHRYGRVMQAIAGVHFNYSFPERLLDRAGRGRQTSNAGQAFRSDSYFALLRNYRRHGWIVLYLFGNSPALCSSFLQGRKVDGLQELAPGTLYAPHATSLRMSDLGYRNKSQAGLNVSVNSLEHYVRDLTARDHDAAPGLRKNRRQSRRRVPPAERQCAADRERVLQLHPAEARHPERRAADAGAAARGVQYVEMRSLDVSVFDPVGVNQNKLRFLEAFAAFCVLRDNAPIELEQVGAGTGNQCGRGPRDANPALLRRDGRAVLKDWALEVIDSMHGVCELLDEGDQRALCDGTGSPGRRKSWTPA